MSTLHPVSPERVATADLVKRAAVLSAWPARLSDTATDPRCGCGADGEGGSCYWDSVTQLEAEIETRQFIVWNVTSPRAPYEVRSASDVETAAAELDHYTANFPMFRYHLNTFAEADQAGWLR